MIDVVYYVMLLGIEVNVSLTVQTIDLWKMCN